MSIYVPLVQGIYTALASAARTVTQTVLGKTLIDPSSVNTDARLAQSVVQEASGMIAYLNITVASGTGGLSLVLEEQDHVSGTWNQIAATTGTTATGLVTLKIKAAIAAIAATGTKVAVQDILPANWRLRVVHADASSYTYSLGIVLYN
jgi:hypothetical protein